MKRVANRSEHSAGQPKERGPDAQRLTLAERIVERSTIDVAACIRWTFFGAAALVLALYPFFDLSAGHYPPVARIIEAATSASSSAGLHSDQSTTASEAAIDSTE